MVETVLEQKWEDIDKDWITTSMFYELQDEHAVFDSHGHDMWSAVGVTVSRPGESKFVVSVECDRIEFGIAKILLYLKGLLQKDEIERE